MKKLLALLMALTLTFQLVTPAWADVVEELEDPMAAMENVEETEKLTEEVPEGTEAETREAEEEATEAESEPETTVEPTEETAESTETSEEVEDEQVKAVMALIEALPSVEELEGMPEEEQLDAYEQIQGTFEAYDALSEEQKAQIPGAESLFEALFSYLNTQITDFAYSDSYQCGPNLFYYFSSSSGTLRFTGSGTMDNFTYETIPWRQNSNAITSIVIPEGVTSIGDYAFYGCSKLKSVSLPSTLKSIGEEAFDDCTRLENISIPDGVTRIAKKTFYRCWNLTNVKLPSSLKSIGEEAFTECKKLYSISIPYGTETLENGAFASCDGLTYVLIPDTVETIGNWAFTDCIALKVADIPKNVKIIGERAFKSCRRLETEVELKQITDLGEQAFYDCEKITSLVISSSSITEIPNLAFNSCYALQSVTLPDSVTRIGDLAFCGGVFSTFQNPKGLKSVGHSAFAVCKNLTSYVIPDGMTTIGHSLLERCSSLSQVVIPGSVTLVEASAFDGCTSLTDIQFGGSQEDWNNISFGSSNTPVFSANIHYSTQATALGFGTHGSNINWKITLDGVLQLSGLGKMDAGTGTELKEFPWTEYSEKITAVEIQPGITSIAAYAFDGIQAEISIPLSVTEIGRNAVSASKLPNYSGTTAQWLAVNFDLAADYTHGAGAICNDGTVLDLGVCGDFTPEGAARYALSGDGCLRIYGAGQVTSAPWILDKDKITTVTIEEGITSICENAFQNCTKLATVTFPETMISVGAGAFGGCAGLKTVHYAGTKEQWGQIQIGENNQSLKNAALVCPQSHICTLEKVEEVPATCKKAGIIAHWRCTVCGKLFSDAEGSAELKIQDTVSAPVDHTIDSTTGKCTVCGLIGGKCGKTVSWALEPSGVLRIYGSGAMSTDKGNIAWNKYAKSITSIVIESGVTRIDKFAFSYTNCAKGTIVNIPLSVTRIDTPIAQGNLVYHYAGTIAQWRAISFYYADNYWEAPGVECTDGTIVTMGYCGTISKGPFYYLDGEGCLHIDGSGPISFYEYYYYRSYWENYSNQIRTVVIGDGVTAIPSYAFNNLHKLEHISIPEGITCIRDSFKDTTALKEIKLPSTLERIGSSAFENSGLESVIIPEGVTSLSSKSFYGCKNLKSVQLPSTLRNLYYEGYTFAYCINLTRINFPENLEHIAQYAFQGSGIRSAKLPEGLTWIGASAFSQCGNLTYVSVPASATRIDGGAFADNPRLSKVDFQAKVDSLPDSIFKNCPALTSFVIPDGVATIGNAAFSESGLKTVTIPITVTKIEDNAFASTSLTDVYFDGSQVEWEKITVGSGNDALKNANVHFARVHVCQPEKAADRVEPTCTTAGKLEYWRCDGCGKLYDDANCTNELTQGQLIIPKLGHDMTKTEAVEPTYWAAGNNAYYTCSRCGKVFKDEQGKTETTVEAETLEKLASVASGKSGNLNWALNEDGTLTISGSGDMSDYSTSSVAPWYTKRTKILSVVVEDGVTSIGNYAFYACLKLASVTLPEGIKSIGCSSFQDSAKLAEVNFPKGVTSIGRSALSGCSSLTSVTIPEGVTRIDDSAFSGCGSLTSVTIPEGVTSIGAQAFSGCSGLTSVTIPEGVTSIGAQAFSGCSGLTSVTIPESVTSIGYQAFYGCSSLTSVTIPESVTRIGDQTFYGCSSLTSVTIPEGVTSISYQAFSGCSSLTSVTIPKSVTSIGVWAFYGCSSLTSITIPESVTSIGSCAFRDCSSLKSITIPEGVTSIGSYAFSDCSSLTSITIPEGVTSLEEKTFYNCTSLESVTLPESLLSIADRSGYPEGGVFENCTSLKSIAIPGSVTSIGSYAFHGCSSLTSVSIGDGVTSIGSYAFDDCSNLTSVSMGVGVTSIGNCAFYGCSNLTGVMIPEGVISIGSSAFDGCSSLTNVTIPEGVTSIDWGAFYGCSGLTSVTIPEGVTRLEGGTFYGCTKLESVTLPEGLLSIGQGNGSSYGAFAYCTSLKSIAIPDSVTSIGSYTFYGCSNLTSVSMGGGVTSIGNSAFYGCSSLTSVMIPESVTSLGSEVFSGCTALTNASILGKITEIKYGTFYNCTSLESVTLPNELLEIGGNQGHRGDGAFEGCIKLTNVDIPKNVKSIAERTFFGCSSLTDIQIPEGIESIKKQTFQSCGSLKSVSIPSGVTSIELQAFDYCSSLTSVSIPQSVTSVGNSAFYGCYNIKDVYYGGDEVAWKQIEIGDYNYPLTDAYLHYGLTHICTTHLIPAIAPTCTTAGNNAYYLCDACGRVYKDEQNREQTTVDAETLPALGHAMTLTEAKVATCTEDGNNAYYTCGNCHKVFLDEQGEKETTAQAEILPALGHTIVIVNTKAPTCTEAGNKVYYTCKTCGVAFKDKDGMQATTVAAETIPALGHTEIIDQRVEPTCTKPGLTDGKHCSVCNETLIAQKEIPAKGHTEVVDERVEPTCTKTGLTEGKHCSVCNEVLTEQEEIPANGHTEVIDQRIEPACTKTGLTEGKHCAVCGTVLEAQKVLEALGHDIADQVVNPTCTKQGYTIHTCVRDGCGYSYTDSFQPAAGHTYGEWTTVKAPTCTEIGSQIRTCRNCDDTQTQFLSAVGHMPVTDPKVEPTCTENGKTEGQHCSVCQEILVVQKEIPAKGHAEVIDKGYEATCTKPGLTDGKHCSVCNETLIAQKEIPAKGHTEVVDERVEPTCTKTGLTEGKHCSVCNEVLTKQVEISAKGHTIEKVNAKEATCTEGGNHAYYLCTACKRAFKDEKGEVETTLEEESLPALGHELTRVEAVKPTQEAPGNLEYYTCSRCEKHFLDRLGKEETTLEEVTLPQVPYATEIDLIRDGQLVPEVLEIDGQKVRTLSFVAVVQPEEAEQKVTWSSDAPMVARVNRSGVVTLLTSGTATITATAADGSGVTAQVKLNVSVPSYEPRLGATTLSLNSASAAGVTVDLVESYGSKILGVSVDDERFTADYGDNQLTLRAGEGITKGTYPMTLNVLCDNGQTYPYFITVKATQTLPKLAVKQTEKFNLFCRDSQAALTITGGEVESAELIGTDDFVLENEDGAYVIRYADPENVPEKPNTKATLSVNFAGYSVPVTKALTIATASTAPKLTLNPAASTLNSAVTGDLTVRTKILGASDALTAWTDTQGVKVEISGDELAITLTEAKTTTVNVFVLADNWTKPVKLTHKITVTSNPPTLKAASGALTLNSRFPGETASTGLILSQGNVDLTGVTLTPVAKEGTPARAESDKLHVEYDSASGTITAEFIDSDIKNGTYAFNLTGTLTSGTEIPGGVLKVTVTNALPKAKLSASTVKLNQRLAGQETAAVAVTLTGENCTLEGFENLPEGMDFEDGMLTVTLSKNSTGGTYSLAPIVSRNGEAVTLPTPLTLKVQTYDKAPAVKLTAKGKLDVLDPDSEIVYTPKMTNCLGTVEDIQLTGADCDLFEAEVVDGMIHLTMAEGGEYAIKATYQVTPILTVCGQDITGPTLSIKVTQSALKLAVLPNRTVYQSQTAPLTVRLAVTSPVNAEIGTVELNPKTTAALRTALETAGGIELDEGIVSFPAPAFAALKPGKYTVILDVTPANSATDTKPIQAKFTLTVQK